MAKKKKTKHWSDNMPEHSSILWRQGDPRSYIASSNFIEQIDGQRGRYVFNHAITSQAPGDRNIRPDMVAKLAPYVAAIRAAEGGKKIRDGIAYGEKDKRSLDVVYTNSPDPRLRNKLRTQAGWAAAGTQKSYDRYTSGVVGGEDLAQAIQQRRTPLDATDDPDGYNKNFLGNYRFLISEIQQNQKSYEDEARKKYDVHGRKSIGRLAGVRRFMQKERSFYGKNSSPLRP
jgi:hypothetical protein